MATTYKILGQQVVGTARIFAAVSNKAITSNVATITTAAAHGFAIGDIVTIAGVDTTHDGTWAVASVPLTTTFTYLSTTATQASTAVTPNATVVRTHNLGGFASANKYSTGANAILTTGSAHGLAVNDWVRVTVGDATTFTYAKSGSTVTSTAVTTGAFGRAMPSTFTQLYSTPVLNQTVVSTVSVTNQTTSAAQYRIAASATTTPALSEMLVFDGTVAANDTITLTLGITLDATKKLMVNANSPEITFAAFGSETA